ncbi:hypothetical protein CVIRNUC_000569 [Coccomyxa viridis]|uniref:Uncharacterized protein n=1 Tax=Coccomyxa viridis TaxID=1274662 RepID=A0AAV1HTI7_9CHLO|nr:hypothetical protein CVIRNUC_000569 [Coccomyxa viridis]
MAGPSEQHFSCQSCRCRLVITDLEPHEQASRSGLLTGSVFAGGKVDESFILLDPSSRQHANQGRNLDESFVMLTGSASLLQQPGPLRNASHAVPMQPLDDRFSQLARTFELASGETTVDQPLCVDCAARVREEMEAQTAEIEAECEAYECALRRLEQENAQPLPEEEFKAEMAAAAEEERAEMLRAEAAEAALAVARRELDQVRAKAVELGELEERYWHDFNDFQIQLRAHVDERDVLLRKIDQTSAHLERLRHTNVYNDAFHIWHEGPFATISGFRLGRTPACPVEWDEINAAWGQAVLLLHTLAQACKLTFSSYRLQPLGSYPRIVDKKGSHDLFGPVNKIYCASYDRAMALYLACLREFAEFAHGRDVSEQAPGRTPLELPYAIDGDKVGGQSIKYMFTKDIKWTKALKYMLTDLKWCMSWVISRQEGSPGIHELQGSPQDAGPPLSESRSTLPDAAAATQR